MAGLQKLDLGIGDDVSLQFASDGDGLGVDLCREMGALFDIQNSLDMDIAFKLSGNSHVGVTFDFPFYGYAGTENGFPVMTVSGFLAIFR